LFFPLKNPKNPLLAPPPLKIIRNPGSAPGRIYWKLEKPLYR